MLAKYGTSPSYDTKEGKRRPTKREKIVEIAKLWAGHSGVNFQTTQTSALLDLIRDAVEFDNRRMDDMRIKLTQAEERNADLKKREQSQSELIRKLTDDRTLLRTTLEQLELKFRVSSQPSNEIRAVLDATNPVESKGGV